MKITAKSLSKTGDVRRDCRFLEMRATTDGDVRLLTRMYLYFCLGEDDEELNALLESVVEDLEAAERDGWES